MAVFQAGASLAARVTYRTGWSLFGFQRVLAWAAPFTGPRVVRVLPRPLSPILAGYLVWRVYGA